MTERRDYQPKPFYDQIRDVSLPGERRFPGLAGCQQISGGADEYGNAWHIRSRTCEALEGVNVIGAGFQRTKNSQRRCHGLMRSSICMTWNRAICAKVKNQAAAITAIRRRLIDELDKLSPPDAGDAASQTPGARCPMPAVATEECRRTRADGICAR